MSDLNIVLTISDGIHIVEGGRKAFYITASQWKHKSRQQYWCKSRKWEESGPLWFDSLQEAYDHYHETVDKTFSKYQFSDSDVTSAKMIHNGSDRYPTAICIELTTACVELTEQDIDTMKEFFENVQDERSNLD